VKPIWLWFRRFWERPLAITDDEQWEQWRKDTERIFKETKYVFTNRLVFRGIMEMFQNNPQLAADGGFVWEWLKGTYGRDMVLAVGREIDRGTEVVNLIQLMYQLTKRPKVVSRKRFFKMLNLPTPSGADDLLNLGLREMNENWFTDNIGAGQYLDIAKIKRDRNWLEKQCKTVMKYRHKVVAHRSGMELTLTIQEIHDALDAIEVMLKKYYTLFLGGGLIGAEPTIIGNWKRPFTYPWIQLPSDAEN
jgi:hypothetical protein